MEHLCYNTESVSAKANEETRLVLDQFHEILLFVVENMWKSCNIGKSENPFGIFGGFHFAAALWPVWIFDCLKK